MKKYISTFIIIIAIIATILMYVFNNNHKTVRNKEKEYEQLIHFQNNMLKEDQNILLENEDCVLAKSLLLVNLKNDTIVIKNLSINGTHLVLFFSSTMCSDCVNYCLSEIQKLISEKEIDKLLLFASEYTLRDLYVFARSNQFPESIFYSIKSLKIPIEQIHQPFMFLLSDNLDVSHFFIPRKEMSEQTSHYFNIVKSIINK